MTRDAYAHDAVLDLDPGGDDGAPGGAITVALCGRWDHEPPCPLAPHHTRAHRSGNEVTLRLLFAAEPEEEPKVRALVEEALARGWGTDPTVTAPPGTSSGHRPRRSSPRRRTTRDV